MYYLGFTTWVQFLDLSLIFYEMLDFFLSKFLSVEWVIFLSDLTGERGWGEDYKKKHKLLRSFTVVAKAYSK